MLWIRNDNAEWIGQSKVDITDANSWSEIHSKFLPTKDFPKVTVTVAKSIAPMEKSASGWVAKTADTPSMIGYPHEPLSLANNILLIWPRNDPTDLEIWRITFDLFYNKRPEGRGLVDTATASLYVSWDRVSGTIRFMKATSQTP